MKSSIAHPAQFTRDEGGKRLETAVTPGSPLLGATPNNAASTT
jgi:hypothetical protein